MTITRTKITTRRMKHDKKDEDDGCDGDDDKDEDEAEMRRGEGEDEDDDDDDDDDGDDGDLSRAGRWRGAARFACRRSHRDE